MKGEVSTVYGPVHSWRLGRSLGVDLVCVDSVCSFRCVYCQLGRINVRSAEREVFVATRRVLEDLGRVGWGGADCVTFSGSGEPTLAANLGEVIRLVKRLTGMPVAVLTNSAHLWRRSVRRDLLDSDSVFCKLDAADDETFERVNRPVEGVTLSGVVEGMKRLRAEYAGRLAVQTMLTPINAGRAEEFARLLNEIRPDEVHLCAPARPVPREWVACARGDSVVPGARLKQPTAEQAEAFKRVVAGLTGLRVFSRRPPPCDA
ncbi:MAG TPA: radical SAM protein [Pyrinomonadaceae bacterium]|jgi:wyosine [tRNA(Phe)-imidazoG37] synthetase (radical SAM superfamily)